MLVISRQVGYIIWNEEDALDKAIISIGWLYLQGSKGVVPLVVSSEPRLRYTQICKDKGY